MYERIKGDIEGIYAITSTVYILTFFNFSFLYQSTLSSYFTFKITTFHDFPSLVHFADAALFGCSVYIIYFVGTTFQRDLKVSDLSEEEFKYRTLANLPDTMDGNIHYCFAVCTVCLMSRFLSVLEFNEAIGPLVKIVAKMGGDFLNYLIVSIMFTFMFALVGNIIFVSELESFHGLFESTLTIVDATVGNFDLSLFDKINDSTLRVLGQMMVIVTVIIFNIIMFNLLFSMLANTYSRFDEASGGLFLVKIIAMRGRMRNNAACGSFLGATPPLNVVTIP